MINKVDLNCDMGGSFGLYKFGNDEIAVQYITAEEIQEISLRCANIRRAFNIRHGLRPEDDTLSPRLLEPPPNGLSKGSIIQIKPMVLDYYQRMGWDEKTGKPLIKTLKMLGLEEVISDIWA